MSSAFEVWDDPSGKVRFCFSHSDQDFTTGVMIIQPRAELPKHNRPLAFENLLQLSSKCKIILLTEKGDVQKEVILEPGKSLRMEKGQWHIHANPFSEVSYTLFKAEGDISKVIEALRETFKAVI